jgi:hypothetical protein
MAHSPTVPDQDFINIVTASKTLAEAHRVMMEHYGMGKSYYREVKRRAKKLGVCANTPDNYEDNMGKKSKNIKYKISDADFTRIVKAATSIKEAGDMFVKEFNVNPSYSTGIRNRAATLGIKLSYLPINTQKVPDADFIKIIKASKNKHDALAKMVKMFHVQPSYMRILRQRCKQMGINPGVQHAHETPENFHIKASSTLVGKDGKTKLQWLKLDKDKADMIQELKDFAKGLADSLKGKSTLIPPPVIPGSNMLLTTYLEPEPHFGMLSWSRETREDYDSKIATQLLKGSAKRLVDAAPNSKYAMIAGLGDGIHADNQLNETTSGNKLDTDSRWSKIVQAYAGFYKWWIEYLLTKHDIVYVKRVKGNHDDHSTTAINIMLWYMFNNNPRVVINLDEFVVKYHHFGKNLIGITHGDKSKGDNLPLLMAADEPKAWGDTEFRYFYTGHIHHLSRKEYIGCVVESFRSIAAKDSWHAGQGYRAGREMVATVLHRDFGEIERHTCNVGQVI